MLWGLIQQGYTCEVCNFVVHDRCLKTVVSPCSSIAANLIKNPVAHCWSEQTHHKRRFCNVCRKRLEDSLSIHCEICDYFVHVECQDFAVPDCKENATYLPGKEVSSVVHEHHWREGNLPSGAKCALCKKTCWSGECLAGMRCEWCGMTCHSVCRKNIPPECTFGQLEPIYLPPHGVSIPRTEVPMEAIIGVQVRGRDPAAISPGDLAVSGGAEARGAVGGGGRVSTLVRRLSLVLPRSCKASCHNSPPYLRARSISEEFSSGDTRCRDGAGGEDGQAVGPHGTSASGTSAPHGPGGKVDKAAREREERDEEVVKVYDGNNSMRRRIFRPVTIPRLTSTEQLLCAAMRAFHILKDPTNFYLTDAYSPDETVLADPLPLQSVIRKEGKRPALFLRFKDSEIESGEVNVYPGKLQLNAEQQTRLPRVKVDGNSTAVDVIKEALVQFGLAPSLAEAPAEDYRLSEILLDRGAVTERVLASDERPWERVKRTGRDSIRQMELMRFYLQQRQDPHGPNLALFVGNLPPNLSQRNYENLLTDFLGRENKFSSIGPIYYEYGSMVITYEDSSKAVRALYILRESRYEDKHLLVMLLPNIEPSMVPPGVQPLLVFVNVKSGGCQGLELISSFRKLLNPYQVFDLDNGGPLPGLYVFRHIKDYRILVCGGDGTIGWVLQCLDNVGQDSECSSPPCAIVPLGTGNDLARVLRWGPGYTGGEDPLNLLRDVIDAEEIRLDRWTVVFHPEDKASSSSSSGEDKTGAGAAGAGGASGTSGTQQQQLANSTAGSTSEDNTQIFVMNNYFGIGIDADLCLDFHNAREENPNKFNSRLHNKGVYVKMGLRKMVGPKMCKDLHRQIRLEVDGRHVELPPVEGIIILNILSWGSGANPWGPEKEDQFSKPNHWDGMLEVVGVTGVVHLGQIQSGLRSAMRIAQGGHIKIHLHTDIPVQVDGEPWVQSPGDVVVLKSALKATMLKKSKMKRRNTEPAIPHGNQLAHHVASSIASGPPQHSSANGGDSGRSGGHHSPATILE
ncbi:diacylglycerol kinase theta isoform X1 [Ischnura elegans]|uniref:diacylglycerol kinase theta isoform X1 n=1 Tax=Ischnura elegans TaxID=197161 RepID=UPI001ED87A5C|nr:diacylglycerol kinase theta isoform X1 [Ischnura elegans]